MSADGKALVWLGELALASFLCAVLISYGLLVYLRPLLARYALAKPNARSSHKDPTPQGGWHCSNRCYGDCRRRNVYIIPW